MAEFLFGAGDGSIVQLGEPHPRRAAGAQHKPHCTRGVGRVSHSYQLGNGGNIPDPKFPGASQEPALQAGLSEVSSLVPATLFSATLRDSDCED